MVAATEIAQRAVAIDSGPGAKTLDGSLCRKWEYVNAKIGRNSAA